MPFWFDRLRLALVSCSAVLIATSASATSLGMLGVTVENSSEPVLCAEKDNVSLTDRKSVV